MHTGIMNNASAGEIIALFERLALEAGRIILLASSAGVTVSAKPDASPVTEADTNAEAAIGRGLRARFPDLPLVAEEEAAAGKTPAQLGRLFALIDPLDGTREFIAGRKDFTVNIALICDGSPEIGVVYAPALGILYSGRPGLAERTAVDENGRIEERTAIRVRQAKVPLRILASRSHRTAETNEYLARFPDAEIVATGSSLKFCLLAAGEADLYPRFGPTMEWDTAAGDAILRAAGGTTYCLDGTALAYGKRQQAGLADFANPSFIASGAGWADRSRSR